jgi:hypothetical protein
MTDEHRKLGVHVQISTAFLSACRVTAADKVNREGLKGKQIGGSSGMCLCYFRIGNTVQVDMTVRVFFPGF